VEVERLSLSTVGQCPWASEVFFPRRPVGDFPNIFYRGAKVVKFSFYPSKLKKQPFLPIISKSDTHLRVLIFYSPVRQRETVDENVKAPHNCDWNRHNTCHHNWISRTAVLNWGCSHHQGCEKGLMSAMITQKPIHQMVQVGKDDSSFRTGWGLQNELRTADLEWMLLLLNSDYSAMKKSLELNRFSTKVGASRHKIYITAIFTHLVLELCKNKNLRYWFKATLTLETRMRYILNTHGYQREICDGFEIKLT